MTLHLVIASEFAAERTSCGPGMLPQEGAESETKNHFMAPNSGMRKDVEMSLKPQGNLFLLLSSRR